MTTAFDCHRMNVAESAAIVVPIVYELLLPLSVLDVGCGHGEWAEQFAVHVPDVYGVDVQPPDGDRYLEHDLTQPLDLGRRFDLVVSLEVGEHLPEASADTFVGSLVRHADTIMFSAAIPGQEGDGHINCQPSEYWQAKFARHGYRSSKLDIEDRRVLPWYRNAFIYRRPG